ncbi:MAG TPA: DUF1360 domain-containing protein [Solirubrobacterales bacterium]|nr:DUF1360 domain-containing protein [Solirubrobacterales bacterium]
MSETTSESNGSVFEEYADEERPLAGYGALSAAWVAAFAGSLLALRSAGKELPDRYGVGDVVLAGIASHKIARLISRDKVTSFVRAPFMRYRGSRGKGEVREDPRGEGLQLAIGELLNCPYCLDHWVASAYGIGLVGAPRATRLIGFIATIETIADYLQLGYRTAHDRAAR